MKSACFATFNFYWLVVARHMSTIRLCGIMALLAIFLEIKIKIPQDLHVLHCLFYAGIFLRNKFCFSSLHKCNQRFTLSFCFNHGFSVVSWSPQDPNFFDKLVNRCKARTPSWSSHISGRAATCKLEWANPWVKMMTAGAIWRDAIFSPLIQYLCKKTYNNLWHFINWVR